MNSNLYSNSIQLDSLISDKLQNTQIALDMSAFSKSQLQSEINSLRYLLYLTNQDRLVIPNQTLRQKLFHSISQSISSKGSYQKPVSKDFDMHSPFVLFENTENGSEMNTVVNTSLFPYSCENTEKEFSFSSPQASPRVLYSENAGVLSTEVTKNKVKSGGNNKASFPNYLVQLPGDDDFLPELHSRENSVNF